MERIRFVNEALGMAWSLRWQDHPMWDVFAEHVRDYSAGKITGEQLKERESELLYVEFFPLLAESDFFCGIL